MLEDDIARAGGWISFEHFMERVLYAPGLGYYVAGAHKFGRGGDFVTAPELTPLFGACLATQCAATLAHVGGGIVEFGGGSGRLAVSLLDALAAAGFDDVPYAIIELSPELRARQRAFIADTAPWLLARVQWWQGPPATPWTGVVIANEIIDALPVVCFELADDAVWERGVTSVPGTGFEWAARRVSATLRDEILHALPRPLAEYPHGYRSELNRRQAAWLADLPRFLARGTVLLIDYGDDRADHYHPLRRDGTLRCYYRQRVHGDPFWFPGVQDITASVDFSALAAAAGAAGFEIGGFAEQTQFLIACGITERLAALDGEDAWRAAQALKILLLPDEMGSRVKCMTLTRGDAGRVVGSARDLRDRL